MTAKVPDWLSTGKEALDALDQTDFGARQATIAQMASDRGLAVPTLNGYIACARFHDQIEALHPQEAALLRQMPNLAVETLARWNNHDPKGARAQIKAFFESPVSARALRRREAEQRKLASGAIDGTRRGIIERNAWLDTLLSRGLVRSRFAVRQELQTHAFVWGHHDIGDWPESKDPFSRMLSISGALDLIEPTSLADDDFDEAMRVSLDLIPPSDPAPGKDPAQAWSTSSSAMLGPNAHIDPARPSRRHALVVGSSYADDNNRRLRLREVFIKCLAATTRFDGVTLVLPDRISHKTLVDAVSGVLAEFGPLETEPDAWQRHEMKEALDALDKILPDAALQELAEEIWRKDKKFELVPRIAFRLGSGLGQLVAFAPETYFEAFHQNGSALELAYQLAHEQDITD